MRDEISQALKDAMRNRDKVRLATLRLITAAIKDRDIEARSKGQDGVPEEDILAILAKMIRQREESAAVYEEGGRLDMAEQERQEIEVIRDFLPEQLDEDEMRQACQKVVGDVGAQGLRDMGKCMGALKARYPGQMDFGRASTVVKEMLK